MSFFFLFKVDINLVSSFLFNEVEWWRSFVFVWTTSDVRMRTRQQKPILKCTRSTKPNHILLLLSNEGFSFFIVYTMGFRLEKTVWNDLLIKENHYVFGEDQQWDWLKLKWNFFKNNLSRRLRGSEEVPAGQTVFFNANLHVNRRPIRWDIQLSFCLLSDSCAETWIWKLKQWP